jgi:hypothetical protein
MEIWQSGFSDHRIRDTQDYENHVGYIYRNPVGRQLVERAEEYPYCSAFPGSEKDEAPQWLKPLALDQPLGGPEGPPLQEPLIRAAQAAPLQQQSPKPESRSIQELETETVTTH